jgi:hypothetical protein
MGGFENRLSCDYILLLSVLSVRLLSEIQTKYCIFFLFGVGENMR